MIIPSIDLMNGKVVQLISGSKKVLEFDNPEYIAKKLSFFGEIALIDLDAAMGKNNNNKIIEKIIKQYPCRVGGGVRTVKKAIELVSFGARSIIIGTSAFRKNNINLNFIKELALNIGKERIIVALDTKKDKVVSRGWTFDTGLDLIKTAKLISPYVSGFLFTSVENEGKMSGYNKTMAIKLRNSIKNIITIAGGISKTEEIEELTKKNMDVQLGMAIYTEKLNLSDAFISGLKWKSSLMPVITEDLNGQVLMMAYMNRASLKKTIESKKMCYYSRSRKMLWTKGERSGNFQIPIQISPDCDRDTLLIQVKQKGPACHLNRYSCFKEKNFSIQYLQEIVKKRILDSTHNSYTASLNKNKIRKKIIEEAYELVVADNRENYIWEAADLIYFITVLLEKEGIEFNEILKELNRRNKKGGINEGSKNK